MKMLPLIAILTLFSLCIEANAQCAPGLTPKTVTMTINGCDYNVYFCVKCYGLGAPGEVFLTGFVQSTNCTQTLTAQQVFDAITSQMNVPSFIWQVCPEAIGYIAICPDASINATFKHWTPICYNMQGILLGEEERTYYSNCEETFCYEEYYICFVPFPFPGHYERHTTSGPTMIGTPSCTLESWEVEVPDLYEGSECFIFNTPCNP